MTLRDISINEIRRRGCLVSGLFKQTAKAELFQYLGGRFSRERFKHHRPHPLAPPHLVPSARPRRRPPQRASHRACAMAASRRISDSTPQSHRKVSPIRGRQPSPPPAAGSVPRTKAASAAESERSPRGPRPSSDSRASGALAPPRAAGRWYFRGEGTGAPPRNRSRPIIRLRPENTLSPCPRYASQPMERCRTAF
jgi:hypothetical protein